jgi:hypothetical protein
MMGFLILAVNVVLPAGLVLWLWRHRGNEKLFWVLKTACVGSFVLWLFVAARWDWTGYWLRYAVLAFWLIAAIRSYRRVRRLALRFPSVRKQKIESLSYLIPTVLFGYWLLSAMFGRVYPEGAVSLEFPLRDGIYYVGQGGSHLQVNQHRVSKAQQYALDVTRMSALGFRAIGLQPDSNEKFLIYGEPILSPCDGQVVAAHDGDPDGGAATADPENPGGNFVVIRCNNVDVFLAHIQKDSTVVRLWDDIRVGQKIGLVGNSGNSTEPHLHIHTRAVDSSPSVNLGVGLPMLFEGWFLVRNSLVW